MKKYIGWEMEIVKWESVDVIRTSGENIPLDNNELPLISWESN